MPDYKLSLSPDLDSQLKKLAKDNGIDVNQLLINAVSLYKNLKDKTSESNGIVAILDGEDNPLMKVRLP